MRRRPGGALRGAKRASASWWGPEELAMKSSAQLPGSRRRDAGRRRRRLAGIERTCQILPEHEAHEHAEGRGERHGQQKTDEPEQIGKGEQRENQPDRM